ncbi:MAG: radical SAM protein [Candidatus Aenigmarchaeota archaeon]|nr:radical SAM protein [Candidatus Aenigmarchaeota archaeon]
MQFERPEIIRPPSELRSYFLPLTSGCSNNTCTFCNYYFKSKLKIRDADEVKKEIDALALYKNYGIYSSSLGGLVFDWEGKPYWDEKRIFLQDGDALVYPYPKLKEVLRHLNEKLPNLERIAAYATPQDILRRSVDELKTLKELKLEILYTGLESGSDQVLQKVQKGVNTSQMIEAARKVKKSGITFSVTVILGLDGIEGSEEHAKATARVLSEMDPEYGAALTLTLVPGTPMYQDWKEGNFHPISPFQSLEELKLIIKDSNFTDCFFSSMHASNYWAIRGKLPQEKERMISELEEILTRRDPSLLRPEYLRGL